MSIEVLNLGYEEQRCKFQMVKKAYSEKCSFPATDLIFSHQREVKWKLKIEQHSSCHFIFKQHIQQCSQQHIQSKSLQTSGK